MYIYILPAALSCLLNYVEKSSLTGESGSDRSVGAAAAGSERGEGREEDDDGEEWEEEEEEGVEPSSGPIKFVKQAR